MGKSQKPDPDKLLARIEELEEQLAEEREEYEWDLKAAKETHAQALQKLKKENERLMRADARPSTQSESDQVRQLTERAMQAEARVAELMEEQKRNAERSLGGAPSEDVFLRQRVEAAESARDALRDKRDRLEVKLQEAEAKLRKAGKAAPTPPPPPGLAKKVEKLQAGLAEKEAALRDLTARVESLSAVEAERDRLAGQVEQLNKALETPKDQPDIEAELGRLRAEFEAREEELKQAAEGLQAREATLVEMSGKLASLSDVEAERDRAVMEAEELRQAQEARDQPETEEELGRLREELTAREEELRQAQAAEEQPETEEELGRLREELTAREEELRQASAGMEEKESSLQEANAKLASLSDLEAERDRLAKQAEELRQALDAQEQPETEAELGRLREELTAREADLEQASAGLEEKEAALQDASAKLASLSDELQRLRGELAAKDEEHARLPKETEEGGGGAEPEADDAGQTAEITRLNSELAKLSLASEQMVEQRERTIERLKEDLEELKAKKTPAGEEVVAELREEIARLYKERDDAVKEREEMASKLDSADDMVTIVSPPRRDPVEPAAEAPARAFDVPPASPSEEPTSSIEAGIAEVVDAPAVAPGAAPIAPPVPASVAQPEPELLEPLREAAPKRPAIRGGLLILLFFVILFVGIYYGAQYLYPEWFVGSDDSTEPAHMEDGPGETPDPTPSSPVAEPDAATLAPDAGEAISTKPREPAKSRPGPKSSKKKKAKKKPTKIADLALKLPEAKETARRLMVERQFERARKVLKGAVKEYPKDGETRYLYGRIHIHLGNREIAIRHLERAIQLDPKLTDAFQVLGVAYLQVGQIDKACDALGVYVKRRPGGTAAQAMKKLLKKHQCP